MPRAHTLRRSPWPYRYRRAEWHWLWHWLTPSATELAWVASTAAAGRLATQPKPGVARRADRSLPQFSRASGVRGLRVRAGPHPCPARTERPAHPRAHDEPSRPWLSLAPRLEHSSRLARECVGSRWRQLPSVHTAGHADERLSVARRSSLAAALAATTTRAPAVARRLEPAAVPTVAALHSPPPAPRCGPCPTQLDLWPAAPEASQPPWLRWPLT